jgi:peptide maturation system acyl carrier-related protein
MHKTNEEINSTLKEIFQKRFGIDLNTINEEHDAKNLLGKEWGFASRDLIYLYFDVEKAFGITIPQADIIDGKFSSISNIVGIISHQLNQQNKESIVINLQEQQA